MLSASLITPRRFFHFLLSTRREVAFAARRRLERAWPIARRLAPHFLLDASRVFGSARLR